MTTTSARWAAPSQLTITLASLGNGSERQSNFIDNSVTRYIDAKLWGRITIGAVTADGTIDIYGYGGGGSGSPDWFSGGLAGVDSTITPGTTDNTSINYLTQLALLGSISIDATDDTATNGDDIDFYFPSIGQAFGGTLPQAWGIVIDNNTGVALNATQIASGGVWFEGERFESV